MKNPNPASPELNDEERTARLTLGLVPGIGPVTVRRLLEQHGSAVSVLSELGGSSVLSRALRSTLGKQALQRALEWVGAASDRQLLVIGDAAYPPLLATIDAAPPVLFVEGSARDLTVPAVAIVGARHASAYGLELARWFSGALAHSGLTIVSGMALGIDAAAHEAAIAAGGDTVAVCATGLDEVYPNRHRALAGRIRRAGALVSEFPLGTKARRGLFPVRNRVIAGLCRLTLVIEARMHSGSLVTAGLAADLGREVCAVPGPVGHGASAGCHALIRDGAWLVDDPVQVLALYGEESGRASAGFPDACRDERRFNGDPDERMVLEAITSGNDSLESLVAGTGLTPARLSSILTALELEGVLIADAAGTFTRVLTSNERINRVRQPTEPSGT